MIVSKIIPMTKSKYKVFLDDKFAFVLYKGELSRFHIKEDVELSEDVIHTIEKEIVIKRGKKRALFLLQDMDRTEWQLRTKLKQGEYREDIIDIIIEYVKSFGYLDDARYASWLVRTKGTQKSKKELYQMLMQKGVSRELASEALSEEHEDSSELAAIENLMRKKGYLNHTLDEAQKSKAMGYLARKGFSYDVIKEAFDKLHISEDRDLDMF